MIVLSINKENNSLLVFEKGKKERVFLNEGEIKKVMRWDKIKIEDGKIKVLERRKPISIDKLIKLKKYLNGSIKTSVYGKIKTGFLEGKEGKVKINMLGFENKYVILDNIKIEEDGIKLFKDSRVFICKNMR